jgi:hypothetical protein
LLGTAQNEFAFQLQHLRQQTNEAGMQPHDEWHPPPRSDDPNEGRVIVGALVAALFLAFVVFWPRGGPNTAETALKDTAPGISHPTPAPNPTIPPR